MKIEATKLSMGEDCTLGNYKKLATAVFGSDSKAVKFLDDKIAESENGESAIVIQNECQMVMLLGQLHIS